jgi:hypothetical protein
MYNKLTLNDRTGMTETQILLYDEVSAHFRWLILCQNYITLDDGRWYWKHKVSELLITCV